MSGCVVLEDKLVTTLEDPGPLVGLPQVCLLFEEPLACPEVVGTIYQWIINGLSIRVIWLTDISCKAYTRWRTCDETDTNHGPWSAWSVVGGGVFETVHDKIVATGLTPYDWYDVQMLHEPLGYGGYQEIWPLCGGYWHLQTPAKGFPAPPPPDAIFPPEP